MARRATVIEQVRRETTGPLLVLDGGSTLLGMSLANNTAGRVIVQAMNAMGYDAMAIGTMDLNLGIDNLLQRAAEARFAILSCNIVDNQGKPIFAPYMVVEREGVRFGLIGLTEPEALTYVEPKESATVLDPLAALEAVLPEVRAKSDVVILLSHLGLDQDESLAKQVSGIAAIVGGRSRLLTVPPLSAENTVIFQAGYDGEWLGRLNLELDGQGQVSAFSGEILSLGPDVEDNAAMVELVASFY